MNEVLKTLLDCDVTLYVGPHIFKGSIGETDSEDVVVLHMGKEVTQIRRNSIMRKTRSPNELELLFAQRQDAVAMLVTTGGIKAEDLNPLDRLGRCMVANDHWSICDEAARSALLNDQHPHVRSCARLAAH